MPEKGGRLVVGRGSWLCIDGGYLILESLNLALWAHLEVSSVLLLRHFGSLSALERSTFSLRHKSQYRPPFWYAVVVLMIDHLMLGS